MGGFEEGVNTTATSPFTGDVQVQLLEGSSFAPIILASLLSTSQVLGVSNLNQLLTGSFVEFDGFIDSGGNFVTSTLDVQDDENIVNNKLAFVGSVLSVTKDANGNLTQFSFFVNEEEPNPGFGVSDDSVVVVNVSPSTTAYQFSSPSTNFAQPPLPFGAAAIVPGQELIVHGTFTLPANATPQVNADKIDLKLQALQGTFSSLVAPVGSDDKTGAFKLMPCATLL